MTYEIYSIVGTLFQIYFYMILVYVLMSWLPNVRESFVGELLGKLVEPYLAPFRRFIPPIMGMIDISPIIALFVLQLAQRGVYAILGYFL
ncbi:YggT family protein [Paenibacillus sp. cl141a]|uniref:YggT family protein n=1 Tax=Paenibacillus TaxID=44249 RepID=UPI0008AB138D|nr:MULTISPECIES: YggT family protein [Paenibacillus]PCL94374.1 YggT family protein [Paenibacillus lautus]QOT07738.1 YggT family protein [Paenibacillus sp. JNUCC-32]SEM40588.1 YggT family protein [Paenibacillus sp. cl141a]